MLTVVATDAQLEAATSNWRLAKPLGTSVLARFETKTLPALIRCYLLAAVFGGADRDRTGDPLLAKQVLSQLSYSPILVVGCQFSVVSRFPDN